MRPFGERLRARSAVAARRRVFPVDEAWPVETVSDGLHSTPSVPEGESADDRYLRGFMSKRHGSLANIAHGERARWAPRFVWIDDFHGRLVYSHATFGKPCLAVPMQDITRVRALPEAQGPSLCFEVSCAPHRLVLEAPGEEQCTKWVTAIERRAAHWKRKSEIEGNTLSATPVLDAPTGAAPERCWRLKQSRHIW